MEETVKYNEETGDIEVTPAAQPEVPGPGWDDKVEEQPPADIPSGDEGAFPPPEEDGQGRLFEDPDAVERERCADCSEDCDDTSCMLHPSRMTTAAGCCDNVSIFDAIGRPEPDISALVVDHMLLRVNAKGHLQAIGHRMAMAAAEQGMSDEMVCEVAAITPKEWRHIRAGKFSATMGAFMRALVATGGGVEVLWHE